VVPRCQLRQTLTLKAYRDQADTQSTARSAAGLPCCHGEAFVVLPGLRPALANRNQTHTCVPPRPLEEHFAGRSPNVIETYRAFEAAARANGPRVVIPERTRIAFQVRMAEDALDRRARGPRPQARERPFSPHRELLDPQPRA